MKYQFIDLTIEKHFILKNLSNRDYRAKAFTKLNSDTLLYKINKYK